MDHTDDLKGKTVLLPDGERVKVEETYADGYAQVRRLTGELKGTLAVCAIAKLEPCDGNPETERLLLGN